MSRAPVVAIFGAPKHRAKRPVNSCRHFRSGSQPLSCLPCRREPLIGGKHRAPKHRADRHEDSCGLACGAAHDLSNCLTHLGTHRAEPTS